MSSEWRGPWKCEKCGSLWIGNMTGACPQSYGPFTSSASPTECGGHLIPYERRKDDALAAMKERAVKAENEALHIMEVAEGRYQSIKTLRSSLAAMTRERDALREALINEADSHHELMLHENAVGGNMAIYHGNREAVLRAALKEGESK